jgi:hypothetical protein
MRVRLNLGRRIGEVVEMDYPTAKIMIADGRATDVRTELDIQQPKAAAAEVTKPVAHADHSRKSSRSAR